MQIDLNKFGKVLTSRPAGKEAWLAFQPKLKKMKDKEMIEINFNKVAVLTPSWADEFITPLLREYPKRVKFLNTKNPSIKASLQIIRKEE
ncbi:STAS-like domain-containing protein [Patescibacteria group bacterium]|nr:STAS-like domain-containing protein [Patescibacteria group bacterium]